MEECRATHQLGVCQENLCFSSGRLPSVNELRQLVEVLDHTEYPILFHCQRGADRTGLASALALLLCTDASFAEGRRQLGLRCGHVPLGRPANLDHFFDLYTAWLNQRREAHSGALLRRWIEQEYTAGPCQAHLQLVQSPRIIRAREPFVFTVRRQNSSVEPWRLRPGANAGIHLSYSVSDDAEQIYVLERAGLFEREVLPGQWIDLTLAVPGLAEGGALSAGGGFDR